ncbi:MAG: encapsulin [Candidatus Omnitrophica bacterium]|nr:encapsulin [Candidatus Omnitrophota bacterium]
MVSALEAIGKHLDREIVPVLKSQSIIRKLIPLNKQLSGKGIGLTAVETFNYAATGGASTDYMIQEHQSDTMDITSDTLKIPVQQQEITIDARTWKMLTSNGTKIESDSAAEMAANISVEQDTNGIQSWKPDGTNVEIDGLYSVAGNTYAGASFDTYGNAILAATNAKKELKADNIRSSAYNLTLHGDQYAELEGSLSTTGVEEMPQVKRILGAGGEVLESNDLTAGTGMVTPIASQENKRFFDLVEAQAPVNRVFVIGDPETSPVHIRQVAAMTQRFKHLDSSDNDACVCTVTGI